MTPPRFVAKWSRVDLPERAASQEHFIDLCRLLGQPTPAEHDATGAEYTFEKGVVLVAQPPSAERQAQRRAAVPQRGYADVWWRGKFAWEYKRKGKYKDLIDAYRQLCQYREALENPPLLIVSDIQRTQIHTNFTGTAKQVHRVELEQLAEPEGLGLLRRVFSDPGSFRPAVTPEKVTETIAAQFATLATGLRARGYDSHCSAHFLMKCMFCLFAEDVDLLPSNLFTRLLETWRSKPAELCPRLTDLFGQMRSGGAFGVEKIPYFNGGLFDNQPALELNAEETEILLTAAKQDWASVEPAIFGTLFERSLDPNTRAQIGAHYTSREDILLVVEPVVMAPLRREWQQVQAEVEKQLERRNKAKTKATKAKAEAAVQHTLQGFVHRLASIRILDPACGSGNFLYVAIQRLLELEKEVITYAARPDVALGLFPQVRPTQLHGLEINPYAAELAQVVVWIGYLQWMRDNGFIQGVRDPIIEPLQTVECRDAILDWSPVAQPPSAETEPVHQLPSAEQPQSRATVPQQPRPATWPQADFIIGNPPFLGSKLFRQQGLEDEYIQGMFSAFDLPNTSDLCCYWFELARQAIGHVAQPPSAGQVSTVEATVPHRPIRAGLLGTQGIRGGDNRVVLQRIKETGDIFMAWSDRKWILDGAAVHVSIVGFDNGSETKRVLDGKPARQINADLTRDADTSSASPLQENQHIGYMGDTKGGKFDMKWDEAHTLLCEPNPNGRPSADVLRPWVNGSDISKRPRGMWIVDFGCNMDREEAAGYEAPFRLVEQRVWPERRHNRRAAYAQRWWIHVEPRPAMRNTLPTNRFLATPNLTKHRLFVMVPRRVLPDHQLIAFARSDDYFFGVLHSSVHELWARRMGTQLREAESGFRYTPTTCFETFPLPWPPGSEPANVAQPPSAEPNAQRGAAVPPLAKPSAGRYRRNLPHIQAEGRAMFVTFCTYRGWILPEPVREVVIRHCLHDHGTKLHMHGLVVMPDHVHLVFTPLADPEGQPYGLPEIMSGIKGASAHSINKALGRKGHVWQDESFDHILRRNESIEEKLEYIFQNPVRKGLVSRSEDYAWIWVDPGEEDVAQLPSAETNAQRGAAVPQEVYQRIADAAKELDNHRERWLNPPEWLDPIARSVDAEDDFADVPEEARALIRHSAIMAAAAKDKNLKRRTLTNLYNERPTWLRLAHEQLDRAVLAAYADVDPEGQWSEDWAQVWVETGAGQPLPDGHELTDRRQEVEQRVLANLLRLNLARAGER